MAFATNTRFLTLTLLILGVAGMAACGGGGGSGSAADGTVTEFPVPGAPPGGAAPPTQPPPTQPPPTQPPPTQPPPTDPPPTDPPPTDPPPTEPPVLPALPELPAYDGFGQVFGATVDPNTDEVFTLDAATGELKTLLPGAENAELRGTSELRAVRALAFNASGTALFAVTRGGAGNDDLLHIINPADAAATEVGTISGYDAIEALTFHGTGAAAKLLAIDASKDVLVEIAPATAVATEIGPLGDAGTDVRGLTSERDTGLLLGVDAARGDVLLIDAATGAARRTVTLSEGPLECFANAPAAQAFFGVAQDGKLHQVDPRGSWIEWSKVRGLAYNPATDELYGIQPEFGLVFRADPLTGWRQPLAVVDEQGLSGLAFDASASVLYALSGSTLALHRVDPATSATQAVGTILSAGGPWTGLDSLAFAAGKLYAVHQSTSTVLEIDPAAATATTLTTLTGHLLVQSLAYDGERGLLLAHSGSTQGLLGFEPILGAEPDVLEAEDFSAIGGLAWIPAARRLVGSDLTGGALVTIQQLEIPGLGFEEVHSLALAWSSSVCTAFDTATGRYIIVDLSTSTSSVRSAAEGLVIEGMTHDPTAETTYAVEAGTQSLYEVDGDGAFALIGGAGSLGGRDIRALAMDPTVAPGVLYGYDNAARKLVVIDPSNGTAAEIGTAIPPTDIEAMAWHPGSQTLLAIDRNSRTLLELEVNATSGDTELTLVAELALEAIRGMAAAPGTDDLVVVDSGTDKIALIDRYTGEIVEAFEDPIPHRGVDDRVAMLLWPRGAVRLEHWGSVGIEVTDAFDAKARLVVRRGAEVLHRAVFEPETMQNVLPVPAAVRAQLRTGDVVTWGVEFEGKTAPIEVTCTIVAAPKAAAALQALVDNAYLAKQASHVRAVRTARALIREGLFSEALVHGLNAASMQPAYVPATRTVITAMRGLSTKDAAAWSAEDIIAWLGACRTTGKGPWALMGVEPPAKGNPTK